MKGKIKKFLGWLWGVIKSFGSVKGILSLFISFMVFYGWALVFIVIGIISGNAWFYGTGTAVIVFWAGPFTPFFPIMIAFASVLRLKVFRDKKKEVDDMCEKGMKGPIGFRSEEEARKWNYEHPWGCDYCDNIDYRKNMKRAKKGMICKECEEKYPDEVNYGEK